MRLVIALGGNALLQRGEPMFYENQRKNVHAACQQLVTAYAGNELIITHGNGPQVGLIALQNEAYEKVPSYPLDVIGAESMGMIGYMLQQELISRLPANASVINLLTQTKVDPNDPAFKHPTKPIGPVYSKETAQALSQTQGWSIAKDNDHYRRVVASPEPQAIIGLQSIKTLVENGSTVICCGGGGVPTYINNEGQLTGADAVIDKDLASSLVACGIDADMFIIATDVDGAYLNWGTPEQRQIEQANPTMLRKYDFSKGSMGPKVEAACRFVERTGKKAVIGALKDIEKMLIGQAGTAVTQDAELRLRE